ncbi:hypothetical protein [Xanthocytophaga flava]|uniref:hypothetical protein n=1 Tax=Xanthocytophaga flava TaxID=3048013 RepID=UPI0028D8D32D|nr:hypothetical protein [Xanthocytophaga flavus]MDJ1470866.1 hypothetical protein [Xanthocytophaga flavus]
MLSQEKEVSEEVLPQKGEHLLSHQISAWTQDPGSGNQPNGGQLIQLNAPKLSSKPLPTIIHGQAPSAKVYPPGTAGFRYWNTASALRRGSDYWGKLLPGITWQMGKTLPIDLDFGVDLNAYYDRVGLKFFHATVAGRTVFSCESPDVVCHEQGHAVLDAIKPQLWDAASIEAGAFHESFGDISSILCALQLQSLRIAVLGETEGNLYRSSRLSRMAEQLGWAIRQDFPTAVDADCLRNAVNSFFYRDPNTIPSSGPANTLSSEPHSFSRVFTGAFFEGLAGMFKLRTDQDEENLLQVSLDMGKILVTAIRNAAVVPAFFSQIAVNMIQAANLQFVSINYGQALRSAFVRHGILSPATTTITSITEPRSMADGNENDATELPKMNLSVKEYDLGVDEIVVHAAIATSRFEVAGAALSMGSLDMPSHEDTAKSFVEDLLRRGRLKIDSITNKKNRGMAITRPNAPDTHETYTHELREENGSVILRRIRIDCGFTC